MTLEHPAYGQLRPVTDTASVLLCDNPGLMTLDGTNTWVLRGPGSDEMVIVDPGPDDDEHIDRIAALGKIPLVLISHKHGDHTDGIDKLVERTGASVRSVGSGFLRGLGGPLTDGEVIDAAGLRITVMATPGHTADSLSFRRRATTRVLTADTVLGRGTTVIDNEDGSLRRLPGVAAPAAAVSGTRAGAARARTRSRRPRSGDARCTWPTARSGSTRCATRCGCSARTPPLARSSSTSTPTSTRSCGTHAEWSRAGPAGLPARLTRLAHAEPRGQRRLIAPNRRSASGRGGPAARSR